MNYYFKKQPLKWIFIMLTFGQSFFMLGCQKQQQDKVIGKESLSLTTRRAVTASLQDLIAYKNSPHQLMMGYYRTWGDYATDPANYSTKMTDLPDSIDIVSVFTDYTPVGNPFWAKLKNEYVPYLHARGTKVIYTSEYFKGASTNPTGLNNWVQDILAKIQEYNFDGWDLDIEVTSSGTALQDQIACFQALSAYLGPQSGTGKLLIYDTNQNGNALMNAIKNTVNYVFLQAYWRSASSLQGTYNTYASYIPTSKFLVGVSFEDATGYASGQMPAYAAWQPTQGTKGGVFAYGIDMEGPNTGRNYITTRAAIQTMNPASGGGGSATGPLVSGGIYKIVSVLNSSKVLNLNSSTPPSNGTLISLWSLNSPATNTQKWLARKLASGEYVFKSMSDTTKVMAVAGANSANGTQVRVWDYDNGPAQRWTVTDVGSSNYSLTPACATGSRLDVNASGTANGTKIQIYSSNSTNAQKFKLVKL